MRSSDAAASLGEIAADQWGLITAPQAVAAGVSRVDLTRLAGRGVLTRLLHGVYAIHGADSSDHVELYAAWLALDPSVPAAERLRTDPLGAVVSHASAAAFLGLGDLDADRHEFTLPARKQSRRPDLRLHRGVLPAREVTTHLGLPVTTPTRTVLDLVSDGQDGDHVAGVLADAVRTHQVDLPTLAERLEPFAARFGCTPRDGEGLLRHLLDLGGATEQVDAGEIADAARAVHLPVAALVAAIADSALQSRIAAIAPAISQSVSALSQAPELSGLQQAVAEAARVSSGAFTEHHQAVLRRITEEVAERIDLSTVQAAADAAAAALAQQMPDVAGEAER